MAGYTRQAAANIATGSVIDADDFNDEYNQIQSAFNASTGHTHDGTAAEGAAIEKVGPSQDLVVTAATVRPKTNNTLDLGTSALQFKDAFIDGTLKTDTLTVDENAAIAGNLSVAGNLTGNGVNAGARAALSAGTGISYNSSTGVITCTVDTPAEVGLGNLSNNGNNLSGSFVATGNVTAFSDERLKENVETIEGALEK